MQIAQGAHNSFALAAALHGRAWALQRGDPAELLAIAERFLDIYRAANVHRGLAPGLIALAAGAQARLGNEPAALALLREAIVICRDDGTRPMAAAVLGFALSPLRRAGGPEVAAVLVGALDRGVLASVANFPGAPEGRVRVLTQLRDDLGDQQTDELAARGAAMSYDELIAYAVESLSKAASS
jgi:hypothetical protein